jgi:hypothetical protein
MTARPATEAAPLVECQPFPVPSALFVPGAFPVPEPNPKSPLAPDEGRLTQFGAGAVVSFPAPSDVVVLPVVVVSTATTRMSPGVRGSGRGRSVQRHGGRRQRGYARAA